MIKCLKLYSKCIYFNKYMNFNIYKKNKKQYTKYCSLIIINDNLKKILI